MSPDTVKRHLERKPFQPLRLHLASGTALDIPSSDVARGLRHSLMVFHPKEPGGKISDKYSEINYRLIERIEQMPEGN